MKFVEPPLFTKCQWLDVNDRNQIKCFYRRYMPYAKPNKKEAILTISSNDTLVASVRLRPVGQLTLLTGMLVHPEYRGQALAHQLMTQLNKSLTPKTTFLFSIPELVPFYQSHHFSVCEAAPNDIQQLFAKHATKSKPLVLMAN